MGACLAYGFYFGQPKKLITGWDFDGVACGINDTVVDYPYLYWYETPNITSLGNLTQLKDNGAATILNVLKHGACVK